MSMRDVAQRHWKWVDKMGWHNKRPLESVALIASEVGELANEFRGETINLASVGNEMADIILRTLDLAESLNLDMDACCSKKMGVNNSRGSRGRVK